MRFCVGVFLQGEFVLNTVTLNHGDEMPLLGLGTYKITDEAEIYMTVDTAIEAGYRLFDTASVYKNEELLGRVLQQCGVPRRDLFITTKAWNTAQRLGDLEGSLNRSLDRLKTSYLDLYLLHWPVPGCYTGSWQEMEKFLSDGRVRAIGVSNFEIRHLQALEAVSGIVPAVNQIENHPLWYRKELIEYCQSKGIQVQAAAPLARGLYMDNDIMCVIGTKYGRTPAQIGLRWAIQKGLAVIPKSLRPEHIRSNADLFSFSIEEEDIAIIDKMNENLRTVGIPEDIADLNF